MGSLKKALLFIPLIIATFAAISVSCHKRVGVHLILLRGPINSSYAPVKNKSVAMATVKSPPSLAELKLGSCWLP